MSNGQTDPKKHTYWRRRRLFPPQRRMATMGTTDTREDAAEASAEVERLREALESREREIQRLRARHLAVPLGTDKDCVILSRAEHAALKAEAANANADANANANADGAADGATDVEVEALRRAVAERDGRIAALEGELGKTKRALALEAANSGREASPASSPAPVPAPAPVGSAGDAEWARRLQLLQLESEARLAMAARAHAGYREEVARLAQQIQAEMQATEARHRGEVAGLRAEIVHLVRAQQGQEGVAAAAARWFQEVGELGRLGVRITERAAALGAQMRGDGGGGGPGGVGDAGGRRAGFGGAWIAGGAEAAVTSQFNKKQR